MSTASFHLKYRHHPMGKCSVMITNIWIYGFGSAGKWASDNINGNVKGFIDSGSAKHKLKYKNLNVISPDGSDFTNSKSGFCVHSPDQLAKSNRTCMWHFPLVVSVMF